MLDVRPTQYIVPLDEQTIGPLTPIIRVQNFADEDALVTGLVRIYRKSLGIQIYTSVLHPTTLAHGLSADMIAETEFDPGSPADDDYFILCTTSVQSIQTGNVDFRSLAMFPFDVKPGPMGQPPATHHTTHELGGMDPIYVEDMPTTELDDATYLKADGAGGLEFATPPGGPHHATHEAGGADEIATDLQNFTKIHPAADSTTAIQVTKADGTTPILVIDSISGRLGIGATPTKPLVVYGDANTLLDAMIHNRDTTQGGTSQARIRLVCGPIGGEGTGVFFGITGSGTPFAQAAYFWNGYNSDFIFATNDTERMRLSADGKFVIGDTSGTARLDVNSDIIRLRTAKTPSSAGDTGNPGDLCWDANYFYVCVAANTWKRVAITTWP